MEQGRKLIAKNTIILYSRMVFVMFVSFYTSRLILQALGNTDFGLYNVVGGLMGMMSILTIAVATGYQRFQNVAIVSKDPTEYQRVVSVSFGIQLVIAGVAFLLGETIGLWFLNTQMTIPEDRMLAANVIFQNSIVMFVLGLMNTPLHAIITAHERMDVYAYISIFTSLAKLVVALILGHVFSDRLIFYGFSFLVIELITILITYLIAKNIYPDLTMRPSFDKKTLKEMFGFSIWTLYGSLSFVLKGNGLNILLNVFFGPVVNAARGIAYQVSGAAEMLHNNLLVAIRPQITKNYAMKNYEEMNSLVYFASRASFLLLFALAVPIFFSTEFFLNLWLGNDYPEFTVIFIRLVLMTSLFACVANPIDTIALATGRIRTYEIVCGSVILMIVPMAYLVLKLGGTPPSALLVSLFITILVHAVRIFMVRRLIDFPIVSYTKKVIWPCLRVACISILLATLITNAGWNEWVELFAIISANCLTIFFLGLFKREKMELKNYVLKFLHK